MKKIIKNEKNPLFSFSFIIFNILCFLYPYMSFSFTSEAYLETVSKTISNIAVNNSITNTFNLDILSNLLDTTNSSLSTIANKCRSINMNKTSFDSYNFRVVYNSKLGTYSTFDAIGEQSIFSILPVTSVGVHLNDLGESVFDWFEVKTVYDKHAPFHWDKANTIVLVKESTIIKLFESMNINYTYDACKDVLDKGLYVAANFYNPHIANENTSKCYSYNFQIVNVIKENEGYDSHLTTVFGDYFIIYARNLHNCNGYSINFDFGSSIMETNTYLDYISKEYSGDNYTPIVNKNNLIELNDSHEEFFKTLHLFLNNTRTQTSNKLFCILSSILLVIGLNTLLLFFKSKKNTRHLTLISIFLFSLIYLLMFFLDRTIGNAFARMFSTSAILFSLLALFISLFFNWVFFSSKATKNDLKEPNDDFYTLEI